MAAAALDPSPEGTFRITHVRGPMARRFKSTVIRQGGPEAWQRLLGQVSPACRARYQGELGAFEWVEADLAAEIGQAWEAFGGEGSTAARGQTAAQEILVGAHPWLLRLATPWLLVQAFPRLFGHYYKGAQVHVDRHGAEVAEFTLCASGYYPTWYTHGITAWVAEALRMAGAAGVHVDHHPPGPEDPPWRHRYQVRWVA
jgi:hypothetical protein